MAKKLYMFCIQGKESKWSFDVYVDPKFVEEWRADEVEIYEVGHVIPVWIVDLGLTGLWCFLQDVFHLKNPFG